MISNTLIGARHNHGHGYIHATYLHAVNDLLPVAGWKQRARRATYSIPQNNEDSSEENHSEPTGLIKEQTLRLQTPPPQVPIHAIRAHAHGRRVRFSSA